LGSAEIEEKSYAEHIGGQLRALGYYAEVIRLEAVNFGIPQKRHRYFILGSYKGEPTLSLEELENMALSEGKRTGLKHALYDLPPLSVADGRWIMAHEDSQDQDSELYKRYLGRFNIRGHTCILFNHVSRFNNEDDIELYANLRQGETYSQLVDRLKTELGRKPDFIKYSTRNFHDKYYRLEWEGQSKTIVSHLHKDGNSFVHPKQTRSLSVREAARIQTFPDDYIFCGSRGAQFIQIGNAVPPVVAEAIGQVLIEAINNATR
jgi:DNA (cytosine-5)-methyltransferase 1